MNTVRARGGFYALIACIAGTSTCAFAEPAGESVTLDLRIAAQPLDEALQEFSRQSGIQVIFFSRVTDGIGSRGANGTYTLEEALKALLSGSGLTFRVINARTVEILRPSAALMMGCCGG